MDAIEKLQASLADRYAVIREIGAGGMATVYLARDVKHDRHVALKVLRPELGAVLGVERFLSEIKVTAHLQHPHLLPLFDSGEADGLLFYVMPYVEGESLRARLDRENQLPMDDALRFVLAVASALEYAHRQGVVHRDLKPENILLQHGEPVVSDFGIALAVSKAGGARVTQTGLSLGTPQYMSPEQATGDREIDARSDQYSLAAVLYEMLTGEPPHSGKTAQAIIARVLTEKPSSARLQRDTVAPHVDAALMRALAKLPADRFPSVGAFAEALKNPHFATTEGTATTMTGVAAGAPAAPGNARRTRELAIGAVAVAGIVWGIIGSIRDRATDRPPSVRYAITAESGITPIFNGTWSVVPSPDGRTILYSASVGAELPSSGGRSVRSAGGIGSVIQLVVRRVDELKSRPLPGTEGASQPLFSPDGKWIAFLQGGKLKKILVDGGTAIAITDAGANNGADWSANDVIVLGSEGGHAGLSRLPAAGGTLEEFTRVDASKGEVSHLWPIVLPDGNTVVFAIWDGKTKAGSRLGITTLKDGKVTNLGVAGIAPVGVFENQLVYVQSDGAVMAVPIDIGARKVAGSPVPILDPVPVCPPCNGDAAIHASRAGALTYMAGSVLGRIVWVDKQGVARRVREEAAAYTSPKLSPDGKKIAVQVATTTQSDVWVLDLASGTFSRLTSGGVSYLPEWTPDGKAIVYVSTQSGSYAVWRLSADGSGTPVKLADQADAGAVLSPDGKSLLFRRFGQTSDIFLKTIGDTSAPRPFLATNAHEQSARFSPSGKWIAYTSSETGAAEVYVRSLAPQGGRVQVSAGGGDEPLWSADGRKLYFRVDRLMMAANVTESPTFAVVSRDTLINGLYLPGVAMAGYDVTRDGSRFLMVKGNEDNMQVVVVANWLAELKARTGRK